jgi:HlyD family secretion protein
MKHRFTVLGVAAAVVLATLTLRAFYTRDAALPELATEAVSRGAIVRSVMATGTLDAVTTVQVGTQVSGAIESLHADFNSLVRRGQLLARLDPSLYQAAIEQARANLVRAQADVERLTVSAEDAAAKYRRARELSERQLIAAVDLDAALLALRTAESQIKSAEAQVTQARAALTQANVNLDKTVITSPIDGIVIARNVDVGQTVAASLQAPVLFEIAADLSRMRLTARVDEASVGDLRDGQPARFTVDAYPGQPFDGRIEQVRLNPTIEQNVVTYAAIISAPNPDLKLKPGMTAIVTIELARREDAVRLPNAALRFRPPLEVLEAFGIQGPPQGRMQPGVATVWTWRDGVLQPVAVRTGLSDNTHTELIEGDLSPGTPLATRMVVGASTAGPGGGSSNPLFQQPGRR